MVVCCSGGEKERESERDVVRSLLAVCASALNKFSLKRFINVYYQMFLSFFFFFLAYLDIKEWTPRINQWVLLVGV